MTALDGRPQNVIEAGSRYPQITFHEFDIEDPEVQELGAYDLVFCSGVLYHLENPFLALRNLEALTRKILLVESIVVPSRLQVTLLHEEPRLPDQALGYLALIPSEPWLIKSLYRVGFPVVHLTRTLPDHKDFRLTRLRRRKRTILLASREGLRSPLLRLVPEPRQAGTHVWSSALRHLLDAKDPREILKGGRLLMQALRRTVQ